jgi:hypothetical protein
MAGMTTDEPDRGPMMGRFIGSNNEQPIYLDLHQIEHGPVADDLADLWRNERPLGSVG